MSNLTQYQIDLIKRKVITGAQNPCFLIIDTGQSINHLLDVLKATIPAVQSWTYVAIPSIIRLSDLPGLDTGEIARILRMKENLEAHAAIKAVTTGGAYIRVSDFLCESPGILTACFRKAIESADVIVLFLGARHVPDDFIDVVKLARTAIPGKPRIFLVNEADYLQGAEAYVTSLFAGIDCISLISADSVDYFHQMAVSIIGPVPLAYDMACFAVGLNSVLQEKDARVVFLIDTIRHLPDFVRALEWLKNQAGSSILDCVHGYYLERARFFYSFPNIRGGEKDFESFMIELAKQCSD